MTNDVMDAYTIHELTMPLGWICVELLLVLAAVWIIVWRMK
jgi:hypothetical protein